jgi:hypothetical protein
LNALSEEEKRKIRAARFGKNLIGSDEAVQAVLEEKKKILERAARFGVHMPELEK